MLGKLISLPIMNIKHILTGLLLLTSSSALLADDLLSVYQQARNSDPTWLAATAGNKAAQESTVQSKAGFLPAASLSGSTTRNSTDINYSNPATTDRNESYTSNSWTLTITQPLLDLSTHALHDQAKAGVRQSDAELVASQQDLIVRTAQAYLNILSAEAELTSVQAEKKAIARQLDQAERRFEVGLIAITDVHEAQASHDLATANEISANNRLLLAREALSEITGKAHNSIDTVQDTIPLLTPDPIDIDNWIDQAKSHNPSLIAATASVESAQQNVKAKRAGHYPTLDLVATGGNSSTSISTGANNTDSSTLGLQFSLPIYAGGAVSSQVRQAHAQLEQAQYNQQKTQRAVVRQTRDAYLGVISEVSRIKALQQAVVSAQSAVDATEAGFEVGTRTIVDVLNAQRSLHRSQADYEQARHIYLLNGLKLKQAAGSLSEGDLAALNQLLKPN